MRVVVVGEQAAGSPTFSPAPAWAGALKGEKGAFKPCPPTKLHRGTPPPGWCSTPGGHSALGEGAGYSVWPTLTCSFSSCRPKVEMPPVVARSGVLGRRHTRFRRSQNT